MDWNYHTYVLNVQNQGRSLCGFVDWNSSSIPVVAVFISSKPIRFRGLKCFRCMPFTYLNSRSLYGFVDWNSRCTIHIIITRCRSLCGFVDWNFNIHSIYLYNFCRGLCSLVDWNDHEDFLSIFDFVKAYVASWIEIDPWTVRCRTAGVEAYVASWIEIKKLAVWCTAPASRLM